MTVNVGMDNSTCSGLFQMKWERSPVHVSHTIELDVCFCLK